MVNKYYEQTLILPDDVDKNMIEAKVNNGILIVNLPRMVFGNYDLSLIRTSQFHCIMRQVYSEPSLFVTGLRAESNIQIKNHAELSFMVDN